MDSNNGAASLLSGLWAMTARAMGSIINAVAVLDIHMLNVAVAIMKTEYDAAAAVASHQIDHAQRYALVRARTFHRGRDNEAPEQKQDQLAAVSCGYLLLRQDPGKGKNR